LRDLHRLALGRPCDDWNGHVHGRLSAMPAEATPLQCAQLLGALSVGIEIMRLRDATRRLGLSASLEPVMAAMARGNSGDAITHLAQLDAVLAARNGVRMENQILLQARGSILALSEVLTKPAGYFDAGAS
jgi:hypothetical protein